MARLFCTELDCTNITYLSFGHYVIEQHEFNLFFSSPANIQYQITYHDTTRNTPLMTKFVENNPPFMVFLDNVPYGTNYRITVAARNKVLNLFGEPASTFLSINEPCKYRILEYCCFMSLTSDSIIFCTEHAAITL